MLTDIARRVVPVLGRFGVSRAAGVGGLEGPLIVAANHSSLIDPGVVLAALSRVGVRRPVVIAAAGLWRVPVLGRRLRAEGHIPVQRGGPRAADALAAAEAALAEGRVVVIYPEGGLPRRLDSADEQPRRFRSGLARLALSSGAPVVPLGQAGARRVTSGGLGKQLAGLATAPLRRPCLHVHLGAPLTLSGSIPEATATAREAVTAAWRAADAQARSACGRRG